jgi:hypothetical protein
MTDLDVLLLRLDGNSFALFANTGSVRTERRAAVENVARNLEVRLIAQATCQAAQEVRRQSQELRAASRILRRAA